MPAPLGCIGYWRKEVENFRLRGSRLSVCPLLTLIASEACRRMTFRLIDAGPDALMIEVGRGRF